jgi:hypothetical protein
VGGSGEDGQGDGLIRETSADRKTARLTHLSPLIAPPSDRPLCENSCTWCENVSSRRRRTRQHLTSEFRHRIGPAFTPSSHSSRSAAAALAAGRHHRRRHECALFETRLQLLVGRRRLHVGEGVPVLHGGDRARGDGGKGGDGGGGQRLILVKLAAAEGAAVFAQAVVNELAGGGIAVGILVVAYGAREGLRMERSVSGNFRFGAPFYIIVLDGLHVTSALWLLRRVRLFGPALPARLDNLLGLVSRVGEYVKDVTLVRGGKRAEGRAGSHMRLPWPCSTGTGRGRRGLIRQSVGSHGCQSKCFRE